MSKTYRLAILANKKNSDLTSQSISHYTYIKANSLSHIQMLAERIGAVVCGWRVAV